MQKKETVDIGTSEISERLTVVPKLTRGQYGFNAKVVDETEIDRLLLEDIITTDHHSTLENFLGRLHRVGFVGLKSPAYDSPVHADPSVVGDKKAHAIRGVVKLFAKMDSAMGKERRISLVNLVLLDLPWPFGQVELQKNVIQLSEIMRR